MKNFESYVKQLGRNTHIRIDSDIIRNMNNGRFRAEQVLRDQFYNYNYILNKGRKAYVDYVEIVGKGEDRRAVFNASRYISRIFEYYGMEFDRKNSMEDNVIMFNDVFCRVQNASCVRDFYDISEKLGNAFVSSVISEIPNGNYNKRKAKYYTANFLNYVKKGEELEEEVQRAIDFILPKFINRELTRLDQLAIDIYDEFRNLESVPNSFVSNIKESDFDLLVSFIILSDDDLCYRRDLEEYVTEFIKREGFKAIQDYKISFMYNDKDVEISMQDLIDKYISVYKKKIDLESPVIEETELPKLDESYLEEKLLRGQEVVHIPTPMFSEISDETFIRNIRETTFDYKDRKVDAVKLFTDKVDLYSLLDKVAILVGTESFDGYFGFEMENGMIILDKFFSNVAKKEISISDAWYAVYKDDFDEFLRLTKMESVRAFKEGTLRGMRGYHTSGWQDEVMDVALLELDEDKAVGGMRL